MAKLRDGTLIQGDITIEDELILGLSKLRIDGAIVTATAAELNKLDGYTGTAADLNNAVAHRTSTCAEHSYIDQAVTTTSSPTFNSVTVSSKLTIPTSQPSSLSNGDIWVV